MTKPDPHRQALIEHRVAPAAAPRFATAPRPAGPAPAAAASLRRRIDGQRTQARARGLRRHIIGTAVPAALMVTALVVFAAGGAPAPVVLAVLIPSVVGAVSAAWSARALFGLDAPTRELRRRASAEVRTARALDPLESAGWVLLHDRLVSHERVPHVLVGPPGAVVLHPTASVGSRRCAPPPAGSRASGGDPSPASSSPPSSVTRWRCAPATTCSVC